MYDVAIVGLGPCGSILAACLDKSLKVIAIDKKAESSAAKSFVKPCGGLLAPDAQKVLSQFGLALPKDIVVDPQIFSVKTTDLKSGQTRHYQRHYINIDRNKFDLWLKSKIPQTVEVHNGAVANGIKKVGGGYEVTFLKGGNTQTVQAKYVVGADGAASVVRRKLFKKWRICKYMAIQQWFKSEDARPFYSCFFHHNITPSYAWGLSKDDSFIFGGAFKIKGAKEQFELLKEKVSKTGIKLDEPLKTEACLVLSPSLNQKFCFGKDGAFFAGEAAGLISPSSLEGISYAIESGYRLSKVLNGTAKNPNRAYKRSMQKIKRRLYFKRIKRFFMYNPIMRYLIMKSGIGSIKPPYINL